MTWAERVYQAFREASRVPENSSGIQHSALPLLCSAAFVVDDIESIFEEHRICSNVNLCQTPQTMRDKGVYVRDENKFIFTDVRVGHRATARFKIHNVNKVPCNVVLSIKPIAGEVRTRGQGDRCSLQAPDSWLPLARPSPAPCRSGYRGEQQCQGGSSEFGTSRARLWLTALAGSLVGDPNPSAHLLEARSEGAFTGLTCLGSKQTIPSGSLAFSFSLKASLRLVAGFPCSAPLPCVLGWLPSAQSQLLRSWAPCARSAPLWSHPCDGRSLPRASRKGDTLSGAVPGDAYKNKTAYETLKDVSS